MYKIYINESPIILCKTGHKIISNPPKRDALIVKYRNQRNTLFPYIDLLEKSEKKNVVVIHSDDVKALWQDFKSIYIPVVASGGVVVNSKGEVLAIFRRGFWDLPKGKIDEGEKKKTAAMREVQEETGINNVVLTNKLTKTYHTFKQKGERALKITHWYVMESDDTQFIPEAKEGIEKVRWIPLDKWDTLKEPTFKNITDILTKYRKYIYRFKAYSE